MGNEQSSTGSSPQPSSNSAFSFLSGRGTSTKRSKGVVVVSGGNAKIETLEDDEVYKRFKEIPRFLPILRHAIGKKDIPLNEIPHKMNNRPLFRMATRFQQHLKICATAVASDQNQINATIKAVELTTAAITNTLTERKKAIDSLIFEFQGVNQLLEDVIHIQLLFEHLVPMVETMNELLVPSERLPPLGLGCVLNRTPVSTSESSQQSTPKRAPSSSLSLHHSAPSFDKSSHVSPIEEVRVTDRKN